MNKKDKNSKLLNRFKRKFKQILKPFRSLRWRLTLSYLLVTVSALLVVELILTVILMSYFIKNIDLTPETLVPSLRAEWTPRVQEFFSEEPPNIDGLREYLDTVQGSVIGTRPLLIFGNLEVEMKVQDFLNFYYLLDDRTLVDVFPHDIVAQDELGKKLPYDYLPGLSKPLQAALDGIEDEDLLFTKVNPGNRIVGAIPVFRFEPIDVETLHSAESPTTVMDIERNLVGVVVFATKRFPWEFLQLSDLLIYLGRSLLIFTLFAGILGSIFGLLTANSLTKRLTRVSQAAHDWSRGDFSVSVRDKNYDELGQLTSDLNRMAEQLENLLDRRQELSILEERNRLARDLHDSVKQQAFAASAQLGAARSQFDKNSDAAMQHLQEAEVLIGKVREELTDLIQELRPIELKGKGLISAVQEYAEDWRRRNNITIVTRVLGERTLPVDVEKSVFRIIQEALANVAWHSEARKVDLFFNFRRDVLILSIRDDGKGFNHSEALKKGIGLKSMVERAEIIGGQLKINSQVGKGTEIVLKYHYTMMEF